MTEPQPKKTPTWAIVLGAVAAVGLLLVVAVGIMAALAISGTKKYLTNAKSAEARNATVVLARGLARCCEDKKELPPTAPAVPPSLGQVRGIKYMSSTTDWSDPAYKCAGFEMSTPQYYRYQWVRTHATEGAVVGEADLDGDGKADDSMRVAITCAPGSAGLTCTVGTPVISSAGTASPLPRGPKARDVWSPAEAMPQGADAAGGALCSRYALAAERAASSAAVEVGGSTLRRGASFR